MLLKAVCVQVLSPPTSCDHAAVQNPLDYKIQVVRLAVCRCYRMTFSFLRVHETYFRSDSRKKQKVRPNIRVSDGPCVAIFPNITCIPSKFKLPETTPSTRLSTANSAPAQHPLRNQSCRKGVTLSIV